MKGLLIKDFRFVATQKKYFLLILFIGAALSLGSSNAFVMGYLTMVGSFFAITTISYDEMNNGMQFLLSLPISRADYIKEKYIFANILLLGFVTASLILSIAGSTISGNSISIQQSFLTAGVIYLVMLVMYAVIMPFVIWLDSEKGRMVATGLVIVIFVGVYAISKTMPNAKDKIINLVERLSEYEILAGVLLAVATLIIFILSAVISVYIMKKKEY